MIKKNEMLFTVDANNVPIEPKSRKESHEKGYWHRTAHIWICNDRGELLCQKRSMLKDTKAGMWTVYSGGHIEAGDTEVNGAISELQEELGLSVSPDRLHFYTVFRRPKHNNNEFISIYVLQSNKPLSEFSMEEDEVDEIVWVPQEQVQEKLTTDSNWAQIGYEDAFFAWLTEKGFL